MTPKITIEIPDATEVKVVDDGKVFKTYLEMSPKVAYDIYIMLDNIFDMAPLTHKSPGALQ